MPSKSRICHLVAVPGRDVVLAAHYEATVEIWSLSESALLAAVQSPFEFGGKRLDLHPTQDLIDAGSFMENAAECLNFRVEAVWRRTGLQCLQKLRASPNGKHVFAFVEESPARYAGHRLDAMTGETLEVIPDATDIYHSPWNAGYLLEGSSIRLVAPGRADPLAISAVSFGILDAVFSRDRLAMSLAGKSLQFFDLQECVLVAEYHPEPDSHVPTLAWSEQAGCFYGVEFQYKKGEFWLVTFDSQSGSLIRRVQIPRRGWPVFVMSGGALLDSSGLVFEASTLETISALDFAAEADG